MCATHGPVVPATAPRIPLSENGLPESFELPGYRIERVLGRGGFGVVYKAEKVDSARSVAVKVAAPEQFRATERLMRECAALERVGAPFAPAVYERGTIGEHFYIAMEYLPFETLADVLVREAGPMPLRRFRERAIAILAAVDATHRKGLIHRDLKPENIFISEDSAKLIDFGLASELGQGSEDAEPLDVDRGVGTPEYMAPELCDANGVVDARADVYALGVILYEMLCGSPPFFGSSAEVQESHRSRRPVRLVNKLQITSELDEAILRCLAKDPGRRFPSVDALRGMLSMALDATPDEGPQSIAPREISARPPAAKAAGTREKRAVGLVFFESSAGVAAVKAALQTLGGQLAQTSGSQHIAVFGHDVGDNPGRSAMLAAQGLIDRKLCKRALVDVAQVSIQTRPDGTRRFMSQLFTRKDRFLRSMHPPGALMTPAAAEVLPDLPITGVTGHEGLFKYDPHAGSKELTSMWVASGNLVGRDALLQALFAEATNAFEQVTPTIATVVSEPGYGKSHLANVLAHELENLPTSYQVMAFTATDSVGGAVNQTLREALERVLELWGDPPPDYGRHKITERLGETVGAHSWAAVALVLGWVPPDHPEVRNLSAAPGALRAAAARALGEGIRIRARQMPLAIVLDDAQLADAATLDALEYATLQEARTPLFVCVMARPGLERGRSTWGGRAGRSVRYPLEALDAESVATLARRLLAPAENVSKQALARLYDRTQGVPRLLVELIRGLKRDGIVRRMERGTSYYLATEELDNLPDLPVVQWSASREVEALAPNLAAHARLASVLSAKFSADEVEGVLRLLERDRTSGETDLDAAIGIQRLVEAGLLVRHRTGHIEFRHALLRDTVYQSVPEALKIAIHRAAFEMYENAFDLPERERLPRIAFHAARGGFPDRAASLYLKLAERAQQTHAYLDAELLYDAALANLAGAKDDTESPDERINQAVKGRALMRFRVGRSDEALKDFETARERAKKRKATETEVDILLDQAEVLDWMGDIGRSATLVEEATSLATEIQADWLEARLTLARGRVHHRRGRAQQALEIIEEAITQAERLGEDGYETFVIALVLTVPNAVALGRLEEAEHFVTRAVAACEHHGDYHHLAAALNNRIFLWLSRGQTDNAIQDLERVLEISREAGFPQIELHTQNNLAECLFFKGEFDAALKHTVRAVEISERIGAGITWMAMTHTLRGRIQIYKGNGEEARTVADTVRSLLSSAKENDPNACMSPGDEVLLKMVELSLDETDDDRWARLIEEAKSVPLQPYELVELLEARARAALHRGEKPRARDLLAEALDLAKQSANAVAARVVRSLADLQAQ